MDRINKARHQRVVELIKNVANVLDQFEVDRADCVLLVPPDIVQVLDTPLFIPLGEAHHRETSCIAIMGMIILARADGLDTSTVGLPITHRYQTKLIAELRHHANWISLKQIDKDINI